MSTVTRRWRFGGGAANKETLIGIGIAAVIILSIAFAVWQGFGGGVGF